MSDGRHGQAPALQMLGAGRRYAAVGGHVDALVEVTLVVPPGALVAVMGPSGSGKSTLLNLAAGLDLPTSGQVLIAGEPTAGARPAALARLRRRHVGVVFQELNLIGSLSAGENVALPRELDGIPVSQARREAEQALADVGLASLADRMPEDLSGGQAQRVAIARALVGGRRLILADEPTGALDSVTGDGILELLRARCDAGAAAVVVTHNPRHAAWADRVVLLRDGAVVDEATFSQAPALAPHPDGELPLSRLAGRGQGMAGGA